MWALLRKLFYCFETVKVKLHIAVVNNPLNCLFQKSTGNVRATVNMFRLVIYM